MIAGPVASVDAEALELLDLVAKADAEIEPAVGEDVDGGGVLGDADGVVQREEQDPGADPDSCGQASNCGGDGQDGGRVAVVDEVVLGDPDVVVAELLGVDDFVEDFVVELGPGLAPLGWIAEVVDQAELWLACWASVEADPSAERDVEQLGARGDVVELVLDRRE